MTLYSKRDFADVRVWALIGAHKVTVSSWEGGRKVRALVGDVVMEAEVGVRQKRTQSRGCRKPLEAAKGEETDFSLNFQKECSLVDA